MFAYVNEAAMTRDIVGRDDMEDENMAAHLRTMFVCQRLHCSNQMDNSIREL